MEKQNLTIYCNCRLSDSALGLLEAGVGEGRLVVSAQGVSGLGSSRESLDGATIAFGQPDPSAILASGSIRWVHISSAGITRYDTPEFRAALKAREIVLTNSSSVYSEPCAEHLLAFMLAAGRNLPASLATRCEHRAPRWQELRETCPLLTGQSAVLLGYGAIARRMVELLAPFRMKLTGYRRTPRGDEGIPMVSEAELPVALAGADHVLNILPDSAETLGFFDATRLMQIRRGAVFYNIGRGTTVDQFALAAALRSGHLNAAWLDVTDPEPLPADHPLLEVERCYITPHVGGGHLGERDELVRHFLENLARFQKGEGLLDRVI